MKWIEPEGWPRASGYANGVVAEGKVLFVGGQIGWDEAHRIVSTDFVAQVRRALENVRTVVAAAGAGPTAIVRMTWYVTDMNAYRSHLRELGAAYRDVMGAHYPAMSLVAVSALVQPEAQVEIEATAVLER